MIKCPHCNCEMKEVKARANPGELIVLDQCGQCGGIWCDKWELFPIDPQEAPRLDPVDGEFLRAPAPLEEKPLYCPRCTDRLQVFHDPLLPPDIQFQRCARCDGIWLNRGDFTRYKQFQQDTRRARSGNLQNVEKIQKLTQAYSDPRSWVTTGTGGIFAYPRGEEEAQDLGKKTVKGAAGLILQTLLRMILGV